MARGFNLTAQLNLRGPSNIRTVVADIRREIGTIDANVNLKFDPKVTGNISSLNSALKSLNSTLTSSTSALGSASAAMRDFGNSVNISNIKNFPQQVNNSASAVTKLGSSSRSASKDMVVATNQMQEFGNQSALAIRRFAAFTAVTTIIFGVTNAINRGVQEIISFDKEMVTLQQITGESRAGLKGLSDNITLLATSLGVSSHELVDISSTLAQAGLSARETEQAIRALALSSLAPSFNDMNDTVEGSIALMKQFNISALQLEGALGSINSVAAKFAVEAGDIITAIQRTGGVFATASQGVSEGTDALNEFIAVFTSVRATTRESAETIATGLRTIFTRIQRGDTIEALKAYGVNLQDLDGKFVGAYKAVELLSRGLSNLDPRDVSFSRIIEELGGFRQIGKVIPLIQQFSVAQAALKVAQQGQGSLAKDATTAQLSLGNQMAKVREQFLALAKDIGSSATFQTMIKGAIGLAGALVSVGSSIKGILPSLAILLAFKGAGAIAGFASGFFGGRGGTKKQEGGRIMKFARGGFVPGTGDGDTVPAMLEPGEFVIRKKAVETLGAGNLHRMNKSGGGNIRVGGYAGGGTVQKFAGGDIASFGGSTAKSTILLSGNQQNKKTPNPTPQLGLSKDKFNYTNFAEKTINIIQNIKTDKFTGNYNGKSKRLDKGPVNRLFNNDTDSAEAWEEIVAKVTGSIHVGGSENYGYPIDSVKGNLLYDAKFKPLGSETPKDGNNKTLNYYLTKTLAGAGYKFNGGKSQKIQLVGNKLGTHPLTPGIDTIKEPYNFEFVYPYFTNILTNQQSSMQDGLTKRFEQRARLDKKRENRKDGNSMRDDFVGQRTKAQQKRFDKEQRYSKHIDEAIEAYTDKDNEGNITPKERVSGDKQIITHIKQYKSSKKASGGEIQRFGRGSVYPVASIKSYQNYSKEVNEELADKVPKSTDSENVWVREDIVRRNSPDHKANVQKIIKDLDSAPKTRPPDWLYTGIGQNRLDIIKQQIGNKLQSQKDVDRAAGSTFTLPGFLSSSKSKKKGMQFSKRGLLDIKTKKKATGIDVNAALPEKMYLQPRDEMVQMMARAEEEFILPRSSPLKILQSFANYNSSNLSKPVPWTDPSYNIETDPFYSLLVQQLGIGGVAKAKMVEAKIPLRDMYRRLVNEGRLDGTGITDKDFVSRVPNKHDDLMNRLVIDSFAAETAHAQKAIKGSELFGLVGLIGKTKHTSLGPEMINGKSIYTKIGMLSEKTSARLQKEMAGGNASSTKNLAESMQAEQFLGSGGNLAIDFDETLVSGADILNDKGLPDIEKYFDMKAVAEALQNAKLKSPIGTHLKEVLAGDPKFIEKIRVLSARPQTSAALIAATLNRLGIPIGADRVTGVSSPGMTSEGVATAKAKNLGYDEALIDDNLQNILAARKANKTAHHLAPVAELSEEDLAITGKAEMEGYTVQQILTRLGAPAATRGAMSMDFPKGLGSVAQFFGIEDNIPTDVKRTIDSASIGKYRAEVLSFLENRDGIFGTKDSKVAKVSAKDTAGDKKNTQKSGTAVQRNLGYIDSDVLADPANASVVGSEMAKLGITKVSDYKMHLSKLAATARNEGSLERLSSIVGVAGSGKSTLMLGGPKSSKADNASLRRTTRNPILTPEDIASVSQVIDVTATVSPERLSGYLTSADKVYSLQSSTKEERDEIKRRKGSRKDTLFNRTQESTAGAPTDSGELQAKVAAGIDPKKVRTMAVRTGGGYNLKNEEGERLQGPTTETKTIGLTKGALSPTTPGHLSLGDAAVAEGLNIKDFVVLVGSNEAITGKDPDAHAFRTVNFDQDFRYIMAKAGFNKSIVNKAKPGFGVPDVFEGESIEKGRRHFIFPGPGSIYVAGPEKTEQNLQKYKDAGYKIAQMKKRTTVEGGTEEVSGTAARAAILSGDIPAMKKFLSPAVFDIVQKNLTQLQNRDKVLPEIMKGVNSRKDLSLAGIEKEISDLLGGPKAKLYRKKYEHDPAYQKMADHVDALRESKRKIESHASFEPFALMRKLAEEFPEKYGLSLTGGKASLGDTVDLQQSVQAKSPSITPGITSAAKPIKRGIGGGIPKLGKEVYDLQKATGLSNFEFDQAKKFGDTMGYGIPEFKTYLAKIIEQKKSKAGMKIDSKALAESLKVPGKTSTSAQLALAAKLKGAPDAAYTPRPSIAEDMASVNRITRGYAIGGAATDTVPALLTPGEFVINKKAAESIGYGQLRRMNHADKIQGFAKGGSVGNIQKFAKGDEVVTGADLVTGIREKAAATLSDSGASKSQQTNAKDIAKTMDSATGAGDAFIKVCINLADAMIKAGHSIEEVDTAIQGMANDFGQVDSAAKGFDINKKRDLNKRGNERLNAANSANNMLTASGLNEKDLEDPAISRRAELKKQQATKIADKRRVTGKVDRKAEQEMLENEGLTNADINLKVKDPAAARRDEKLKDMRDERESPAGQVRRREEFNELRNAGVPLSEVQDSFQKRDQMEEEKMLKDEGLSPSDIKKARDSQQAQQSARTSALSTLKNTKTENLGNVIKLPELQIKNLEKSFADAGVKSGQLAALVAKGGNISFNAAMKAMEGDIKRARAAGASIDTIAALEDKLAKVRNQGQAAISHAAGIKGSQKGFVGGLMEKSSNYIQNSKLVGKDSKLGMLGSGIAGQGGMFLSMGLGMAAGHGETFFGKKNSSKEAAGNNAAFESGMGAMSAGIGIASQVAMIPVVGPALAGVVAVGTALFAVTDSLYDLTGSQKAATEAFEQQARDKTVAAASAGLGTALDKLSKNASDVNAQKSAMSNIKTMNSTQSTSLSKQIDISKNERTLGQFLLGRSKKGISNEEIRDMAVTDAGSEASQRKAQGARSLIEIGIKGGKSLEDISKGPDSQALGEALARSDPATAEKLARMDEVSKNNPKLKEENEKRKEQIYKEAITNDPALKASVTMIALEKSAKASALAGKKLSDTFESMAEKIHQAINNTIYQLDAMSVAEQSYIDGLEGKSKVGAFKSESLNILNNPKAFSKDQVAQANANAANMVGGGKTSRDVAAIANLGNTMNTKAADAVKGVAAGNANVDIKGGIGAARAAGIDEIRKSGASVEIQEQLISQLNSELDNLAHKFEQQQNAGGQVDIQELYNGIQNSTKLVGDQGAKLFAEANKATLALREGVINKFNDSVNAASERLQKAFNYQQKATTIMGSTRRQINEIKTGDKEDFYDIAIRKKQETRTLTGGPTNAADIRANSENLNRRRQAQQDQLKATTEANMVTAGALGPNSNANRVDRAIAQQNNNAMIQQTVALDQTNRALANSHTALENLANDAETAAAALSSLQNIKGLQQSTIQYSKKLLSTSPEEAKKLAASFGRLTNDMNGVANSSKNSEEAQKAYMDELKSSGNVQKANMAGQAVLAAERGADLQNFEESKPRRELALKNEQAAKVEAMRQQSGGVINLEAEQQMLKQQGLTDSDIRQKLNTQEADVMAAMGKRSGLDKSPEFQKDLARLRDPNADAAMRVAEQNAMAVAKDQANANIQMGLLNISMANLTAAVDRLNSSIPMLQQGVQQQGLAAGGVVYASAGQSINFQSRGTDTVPAMLTPGEFVVNRQSSSKNLPILQAINSGHYDRGGIVNYLNNGGSAGMKYFAAGSMVPNSPNSIGGVSNNVDTQQMQKDMESFKRTVDTLGEFIKGFAESTTNFTTSTEDMSSSISSFVQGAKEIPQELNITGSMTNKTQVDFKGAEVFSTLEPSFSKLAETNLINAMTNLNMGLEGSLFQGDAKSIIGKGKKG